MYHQIRKMKQTIIKISEGVARNPQFRLREPISASFFDKEHIAIAGSNGMGKSLFVDTFLGKYPLTEGILEYNFLPSATNTVYGNIKYITFRDSYGAADSNYYYQQRWNANDQDEIASVQELLGEIKDEKLKNELFELFSIEPMLNKKIILLSSGELRKFQLTKALLTSPRVLILDNPFIGLDVSTRNLLAALLQKLASRETLQIILVLSVSDDIPEFITHVVMVDNLTVFDKQTREQYLDSIRMQDTTKSQKETFDRLQPRILDLPYINTNNPSEEVIRLNDVCIRYGERTILGSLNWVVSKGEKWALSGENGSGKSTLLSLVCADNPQSYACDISLFGKQRGSGESIWEIKKRIGYVSPEMHRSYSKNLPAIQIVASGLHDSIGLYKQTQEGQMHTCEWWMDIFGIAGLKDKPFLQLSSGEQRLALLARAFVKDPELLILDEPLHGLDTYNRSRVKKIIEAFCERKGKTMIMVTHYESELPNNINHRLMLKKLC